MTAPPLLAVENLTKHFPVEGGWWGRPRPPVRAVDGVSLHLDKGEVLAIAGESGCGKSTLGRAVLRLIEPTSGAIRLDGTDVLALSRQELRKVRRRMQIVFQDPYASLNPRMRVGGIVGEPLRIHNLAEGADLGKKVAELLETVGLPADAESRYPHEFSGGQRQRIGVARALAVQPEILIADEPVSALDVSVQAQILNLLQDLKEKYDLSFIFISHDLNVVRFFSDRIAIMYLGQFVEAGTNAQVFGLPHHPYTVALLSAVPVPDPARKRDRILLPGDLPNPAAPPPGCRFHTRCPLRMPLCESAVPALTPREDGRLVACHLSGPARMGV